MGPDVADVGAHFANAVIAPPFNYCVLLHVNIYVSALPTIQYHHHHFIARFPLVLVLIFLHNLHHALIPPMYISQQLANLLCDVPAFRRC